MRVYDVLAEWRRGKRRRVWTIIIDFKAKKKAE